MHSLVCQLAKQLIARGVHGHGEVWVERHLQQIRRKPSEHPRISVLMTLWCTPLYPACSTATWSLTNDMLFRAIMSWYVYQDAELMSRLGDCMKEETEKLSSRCKGKGRPIISPAREQTQKQLAGYLGRMLQQNWIVDDLASSLDLDLQLFTITHEYGVMFLWFSSDKQSRSRQATYHC